LSLNLENNEPLYSISTAARLLGISVPTLRMYENEGLILPYKKESKHRLYSKEDLERIECIRSAINKEKISINGIKTIFSLIPCWKILNCGEKKETCKFFNDHSNPCWVHKHENNSCANNVCRECDVYKNFSNCSTIKQKLYSLTMQ
jgi:MerR family transcriptional regulator/heat shock protein HspR